MRKKIQLIEKQITEVKQLVRISDELDRQYDKLTGISFLEKVGKNCLLHSSSVDGKELFAKNFEVEVLQTNLSVAPDERFFTLDGFQANGSSIDFEFQDGGKAVKYPYTLKIYLRLEHGKD